jgi:hypothetical protein
MKPKNKRVVPVPPSSSPEGSQQASPEGSQGANRCTEHRSFNGCELTEGHAGPHKAGGLTWGGKE